MSILLIGLRRVGYMDEVIGDGVAPVLVGDDADDIIVFDARSLPHIFLSAVTVRDGSALCLMF